MNLLIVRMANDGEKSFSKRLSDLGPVLIRYLSEISPGFYERGPNSEDLSQTTHFFRSNMPAWKIAREIAGLSYVHPRDQFLILELGSNHGEINQNAALHRVTQAT